MRIKYIPDGGIGFANVFPNNTLIKGEIINNQWNDSTIKIILAELNINPGSQLTSNEQCILCNYPNFYNIYH